MNILEQLNETNPTNNGNQTSQNKLSFFKMSPGQSYAIRMIGVDVESRYSVTKWNNGKSIWGVNLTLDDYKNVQSSTKLTGLNYAHEWLIPVLDLSDNSVKILSNNKKTFREAVRNFIKENNNSFNFNVKVTVGTAMSKTGNSVYHTFTVEKLADQSLTAEQQNVVDNFDGSVLKTIVSKTTKTLQEFATETGVQLI